MQRELTVVCHDGEDKGLIEAARYLDGQMQTMSRKHQALGLDRCAIMVALNISHELLQMRRDQNDDDELSKRLGKLQDQIDQTLDSLRPQG